MQASTIIFKNESSESIVEIPSVAIVELEPPNDNVFVLSDSKDENCHVVDFFWHFTISI